MTASAELWPAHERRVLDVAYRMLGSLTDAEDIAQEAYLRFHQADVDAIEDVRAWLMAVTARLCLDRLRSAAMTRTSYIGPWLPEPIVTGASTHDPADRITLDDTVRLALLVALERLSPAERTAFVLHDVFGVPYDEIAGIVGRSVEACRKAASRARTRVHAEQRFDVSRDELEEVAVRFRAACETGDLEALVSTLDPHVTGDFDSGGVLAGAPTKTTVGAETVAALLLSSFRDLPVTFTSADVNGEPGVVARLGGRVVTAVSLTVSDGLVQHINAIGNPAKLRGSRV